MSYPTNPTTGDTHIISGKTWKYDGTNWAKLFVGNGAGEFSDLTSTPTTLAGYGITDGATSSSVSSGSVPAGMIMPNTSATEPAGWLECDGAAVSRSTYSALFAVISDDYGAGDGSTTFNLPDLRGQFVRGFANGSSMDADRGSRTNRGDGTTGDFVGTIQNDAIVNIVGTQTRFYGLHTTGLSLSGAYYNTGGTGDYHMGGFAGAFGHNLGFDASRVSGVDVGSDVRPNNVQLMYCIKT